MRTTHVRLKTGKEVIVTRYEGNTVVVTNKRGKVIGVYDNSKMPLFYKRYKSLVAKKSE
jgi:hypothetical protein